jgi:membrane protein
MRRALRELVGLFFDSGISGEVPALAWFLLSSLAPLALGLTALAAVVLGDWAEAQALAAEAAGVLPADAHDQVVQLVLRTHQDSPLLIAGAIVGMVWTSSGAVGVIDRCIARLLDVDRGHFVLGKLRTLGVAAAVAVVIVIAVLVASAGTGFVERVGLDGTLTRVLVPLVSTVVITLICAGVFHTLALGGLRWRAALSGAVLSGVVLQVTPTAAGYYLRYVAGSAPVKVFLMLAGVLITCYLIALALLLGTGVAARVQLGRRLGDVGGSAVKESHE